MRITNTSSMIATNALNKNDAALNKSIEKLSSGLRINRAADDAAGLAVSEKMKTQTRGLEVAQRNIQDGISMIQTAEGALVEVQDMVQRLRELTVQGTNGIYAAEDVENLNSEAKALVEELKGVVANTTFNGVNVFGGVDIQTGVNAKDKLTIAAADFSDVDAIADDFDTSDSGNLAVLDDALQAISNIRADLGANQNRLEHAYNSSLNLSENLTASQSRITDVDMAKEMSKYSATNVLLQAGASVLSQANSKTQLIQSIIG